MTNPIELGCTHTGCGVGPWEPCRDGFPGPTAPFLIDGVPRFHAERLALADAWGEPSEAVTEEMMAWAVQRLEQV